MFLRFCTAAVCIAALGAAQEAAPDTPAGTPAPAEYTVNSGTRIPLSLINTISTKHAVEGDRVYLETAFPVLVNGRIVIPVGSYVAGTVTQIKKPGRVKGRAELYVRFDSLTLPNGVTRDFRARLGGVDGQNSGELDRSEGKLKGEGNKVGDARTVGESAGVGASIGVIAGSAAGNIGMGAAVGGAAGAAAGLIGVLATRGPDAVLARGSTVEMVLDRPVLFHDNDLNFANTPPPHPIAPAPPAAAQTQPVGSKRWPW
jgi:type IV secretion system protein VirB10